VLGNAPTNDAPYRLINDVEFGDDVIVQAFTNLYGCRIGSGTRVGPFVEIQRGVVIGARCKIQSHSFLCEGVTLEDEVFVGHGVMFINDRFPRATNDEGLPKSEDEWRCEKTLVKRGASIGSNATVLCGVTIGERAIVGAGSVVTKDVPAGAIVAGNPAQVLRSISKNSHAGSVS
jgi:UDP-2-acetamido-3-amino-2,3-dideoxy-glucuronate N-acetyltransferase